MSRPNIFEYLDFRAYLRDFQTYKFSQDKKFSRNKICIMLGLPNTRSYFRDVLKGKKVTETFIERFIEVLELSKRETQYFRVLVGYNQSTNADERELLFEQIISLNNTPKKLLDKNKIEFYREWHHSVVRALLDVYDINTNYSDLAQKILPPISAKKVKDSIDLMEKLELVKRNDNGFFKPSDKAITAGPYIQDECVKLFQHRCIEMAGKAVFSDGLNPKNISTNTLSISQECYVKLEKYIQKFKSEVRTLVFKDTGSADRVFQLNINFFPQSK